MSIVLALFAMNKYIICYPLGGISDMFNIMNNCLKYAINNNRMLIINTSGDWFRDNIYKFIEFTHNNIYKQDTYDQIYNLSVYPPTLNNMLGSNMSFWWVPGGIINALTNEKLTTDLSQKYDEDVVIYSNCGNTGDNPLLLLENMYFKNIITDVYNERLSKLPKNYTSIHIRNTDIQSDVVGFLEKHNNILKDKMIFLASDDIDTIKKYKELYGSNLFNFSNMPNTKHIRPNANIHYHHVDVPHEQFIIECMVDLLLLASGDEYYYSSSESGYSKLALVLFENKNLLNKILNK